MSTNNTQSCAINSDECNGKFHKVGDKVSIPKTNIELISYGMILCTYHYNKLIINENHRLEKMLQFCSHPKHEEYKSQSKKSSKKPKKHSLEKVSKRLIPILQLDENAKICSLCRMKTDSDPDYTTLEEYNAPISKKNNNNDILKIGNHTYPLRNDILYNQTELKQLEQDYQEIISQISIPCEVSLSEKIKIMSDILYTNQRQLNQKPIYDFTKFKIMLEKADEHLIGFIDELYEGTNPTNKSEKTNSSNKKKLVSLCYFLASINNKYINGIKVDIGSYL